MRVAACHSMCSTGGCECRVFLSSQVKVCRLQEYNLQAARAGGHRAHPHPTSDRPATRQRPWRRSTLRLSTRPTRYRSCSERCRRQQQVVDVRQQPRRGPRRRDRTAARRRAAAEPCRLHVDGRSSGGREAGDQRPDVAGSVISPLRLRAERGRPHVSFDCSLIFTVFGLTIHGLRTDQNRF